MFDNVGKSRKAAGTGWSQEPRGVICPLHEVLSRWTAVQVGIIHGYGPSAQERQYGVPLALAGSQCDGRWAPTCTNVHHANAHPEAEQSTRKCVDQVQVVLGRRIVAS